VEGPVATKPAFNHYIDTVGERVRRDAAIYDVVGLRAVGHRKRGLTPASIALDRSGNYSRPDFDAGVIEGGVRDGLRRQLVRREIIDGSVPDGACHQIPGAAEYESATKEKFRARFHASEYRCRYEIYAGADELTAEASENAEKRRVCFTLPSLVVLFLGVPGGLGGSISKTIRFRAFNSAYDQAEARQPRYLWHPMQDRAR